MRDVTQNYLRTLDCSKKITFGGYSLAKARVRECGRFKGL